MKIIKYFNNELVGYEDIIRKEKDPITEDEIQYIEKLPLFEIRPLRYKCTNGEFNYWVDIITRTYGRYGEVTHEDIPDPPKEPTEVELISELTNGLARQLTQEKLEHIRLKTDVDTMGEGIVQIRLMGIQGGTI